MSILKKLVSNPLGGEKKPWKPFYGYLFLVVLMTSVVLSLVQRMQGETAVPMLTNSRETFDDTREEKDASSEAQDASTDAALNDVAKAALEILELPQIKPPPTPPSPSGDR